MTTPCTPKCINSLTSVVRDFTKTWLLSYRENISQNHQYKRMIICLLFPLPELSSSRYLHFYVQLHLTDWLSGTTLQKNRKPFPCPELSIPSFSFTFLHRSFTMRQILSLSMNTEILFCSPPSAWQIVDAN